MLCRVFKFIFVSTFFDYPGVYVPCLLINVWWSVFTARLNKSTSLHSHFFLLFRVGRGGNTAMAQTWLFHGQNEPTNDSNCSPIGYYSTWGKGLVLTFRKICCHHPQGESSTWTNNPEEIKQHDNTLPRNILPNEQQPTWRPENMFKNNL
jgi:hypothetical protein